jgi:hypothetical protein
MPSLIQLADWLRQEIAKGKGHLHTNHVVIVEEEVKKRKAGGSPDEEGKLPTRIVWNCGENWIYREWHEERERWMQAADNNPATATEAMIQALRVFTPEGIQAVLNELGNLRAAHRAAQEAAPGPPKAILPDWQPVSDSKTR